jgi:CRISPR-associated protein Cmr1
LKYDLRRLFANDKDLRHFIMGTVEDERIAAKVKMSHPYNGDREMRVWGWIPEEANVYRGSWNRNAVVDSIHQHLHTNYGLQVWREMNSTRDTVRPNNGDAQAFLRDLLAIEEEDDAV